MGLYINNHEYPEVYKSSRTIKAPNQTVIRKDNLSEMLDEQKEANVSLSKAIEEMKQKSIEYGNVQAIQWDSFREQLYELKKQTDTHSEVDLQIIQWLKTIDERMEKYETANQQLFEQLNNQYLLQKQMSNNLLKQEDFQSSVISRLEKQEALTEKISRQLNHIRSILFERTNYLAEKVEEGYRLTSSYVYNLMTGSEKPLTFYLLNKQEEKNK